MSADGSCSFHSFHSLVVCSDVETFSSLDLLPSTLISIILTESGLIYGELSNSFNICKFNPREKSPAQEREMLRDSAAFSVSPVKKSKKVGKTKGR